MMTATAVSDPSARPAWLEPVAWVGALVVLSALMLSAGMENARLKAQLPIAPKALYKELAKTRAPLQVIDIREDLEEYEDTHVPGAIPFPGCDPNKTAPEVMERIIPSIPTVIVTEDGDEAAFKKCAPFFKSARNLKGGIEAWDDEGLPEDSDEYVPPKPGAGGGCL